MDDVDDNRTSFQNLTECFDNLFRRNYFRTHFCLIFQKLQKDFFKNFEDSQGEK